MENPSFTIFELDSDQSNDLEELRKATGCDRDTLVQVAMELGVQSIKEQIEEKTTTSD